MGRSGMSDSGAARNPERAGDRIVCGRAREQASRVVAIDYSDGWLRWVRVGRRGERCMIEEVVVRDLRGAPEPEWPSVIRRSVRRGWRGAEVRVVLPDRRTMLQRWRLPSHDPDELSGMASLRFKQQFPYDAERLVWGYCVTGAGADVGSALLLIVAQREPVERCIGVVEAAVGPPGALSVGAIGLYQWFRWCEAGRFPAAQDAFLVVEIEALAARLVVATPEGIAVGREVTLELLPQGGWRASLIDEVRRTETLYRREGEPGQPPIGGVVVTGLPHLVESITATLQEALRVPCRAVQALPSVAGACRVAEGVPDRSASSVSLAAVLGLALADADELVSVVPESVRERYRVVQQQRALAVAIGCVVALVAASALSLAVMIRTLDERAALVRQAIAPQRPLVEQWRRFERLAEAVRDQRLEATTVLDVMDTVCRSLPEGVTLTSLVYDGERAEAMVQGVATSMDAVLMWVRALDAAPFTDGARIRYVRQRSGTASIDFVIDCRLVSSTQRNGSRSGKQRASS